MRRTVTILTTFLILLASTVYAENPKGAPANKPQLAQDKINAQTMPGFDKSNPLIDEVLSRYTAGEEISNSEYMLLENAGLTVSNDNSIVISDNLKATPKPTTNTNNYNRLNRYSRTQTLSDDFSYSDGSLIGNGSWVHYSGNTDGEVQVSNGSVLINDSDYEDVRAEFAPITSGTLYFGIDVTLADPGSYSGTDFEYFGATGSQ